MTDEPSSDAPADVAASDDNSATSGRDVVVPMEVYKAVSVFSTLFAVIFVLLAFSLFDAATLQRSFLRGAIQGVFEAVGLTVGGQPLSIAFALLGFAALATGSGIYILGSRFRAEEMGNAKDEDAKE